MRRLAPRRSGYIGEPIGKDYKVVSAMSAKDRSRKAVESAWAAQGERYLQRVLQDEELRDNLRGAYISARSAYGRMSNGKGPTHALLQDKKLQRELVDAANALRSASSSLREPPRPRRRRRARRSLLLLIVGAGLAIALTPQLRSKVLDLMFGAEEEFDYTSTTTPPAPAPAGVAGS
jgi:hypothetical protein